MTLVLSIVITQLVPALVWAVVIAGLCLIVRARVREERSVRAQRLRKANELIRRDWAGKQPD
jgi:hypothetical protein